MPRSPIVLVVSVALAAAPAPALAQGAGLYEPFPEPVAAERAQRYLQQIGVIASDRDLREGRFLGSADRGAAPARPSGREAAAASGRAGIGSDQAPWPLLALLAGVLAAGAAAALRPPAPSPSAAAS